jgi:hypothetical protein
MGKGTDKKTSPAEDTDEDPLVIFNSKDQKQKTEQLTKTHHCATVDWNMKKLVNGVSAVQSKLQEIHEAIAIRDKLEVNIQDCAHINEEIKNVREKLYEDNVMKTEIKELKFKVQFLMEVNHNQLITYEEELKRFKDSLYRISTANKELREEIYWIRQCHKDHTKAAKRHEALRHFRAAGSWKTNEKQVSHFLVSCRESGEFKYKCNGRWLSSVLLRRVAWWNFGGAWVKVDAAMTEPSLRFHQTTCHNNSEDS